MMNEIRLYSKINPKRLLHQVWYKETYSNIGTHAKSQERIDLVDPDQFIQCSALHMQKGRTFKPHRHIWKMKALSCSIAQESWFVVSGKVKMIQFSKRSYCHQVMFPSPLMGDTTTRYSKMIHT